MLALEDHTMSESNVSVENAGISALAARSSKSSASSEDGSPKVSVEAVDQGRQVAATPKTTAADEIVRIEQVEDRSLEIATETFSIDRVRDMVRELEAALPKTSNSLSFQVDEVLNRPVITVTDQKSGQIVRTLPSDEVIRVMHNIDKMRGILFEDQS